MNITCDEPCVVKARGTLTTAVERAGKPRRLSWTVRRDGAATIDGTVTATDDSGNATEQPFEFFLG